MVLFRFVTARVALNAVLQWPMRSRFAIHSQVIVVSPLSLSAIRAFALSPLARFSNSPSFQPVRIVPADPPFTQQPLGPQPDQSLSRFSQILWKAAPGIASHRL